MNAQRKSKYQQNLKRDTNPNIKTQSDFEETDNLYKISGSWMKKKGHFIKILKWYKIN